MEWNRLLCQKRIRQSSRSAADSRIKDRFDLRNEFEKTIIALSEVLLFAVFRIRHRSFLWIRSDFIHTRLTHSLEVASFGKSLGHNIGENILASHKDSSFTPQMKEDICHILECAGLIHDIGNPPSDISEKKRDPGLVCTESENQNFSIRRSAELLSPQMYQDLIHFEGNAGSSSGHKITLSGG